MRALFALFGAGVGIAVLLAAGGLRAPVRLDRPARAERRRARAGISAVRIAGVLAAAALVGAVSRWPVAAGPPAVAPPRPPPRPGPRLARARSPAPVPGAAG